jgi:hypothetical protein
MGIFSFFTWGNDAPDPLDTANQKIADLEKKLNGEVLSAESLKSDILELKKELAVRRDMILPKDYVNRALEHVLENYSWIKKPCRKNYSEGWHRCELRFPVTPKGMTTSVGFYDLHAEAEADMIEITILVFYVRFFGADKYGSNPKTFKIRFGELGKSTSIEFDAGERNPLLNMSAQKMFNKTELQEMFQSLIYSSMGDPRTEALQEDLMNCVRLLSISGDTGYDGLRTEPKWGLQKNRRLR